MDIWLHGITTATPEYQYKQKDVGERIVEWTVDDHDRRLAKIAHKVSGIDTRHSVLPTLGEGFFARNEAGAIVEPSTGARNQIYRATATPLALEAVERMFENIACERSEITHIITVSCTGFFNPGLDYHIIEQCGLSESTQRYHLGFMGCYAAISALDMARQFSAADENAVVLVVSLELCSLHLKPNGGRDAILANALFADGVAACLVSAREPAGPRFRLGPRRTQLVSEGESEMAWDIGDLGFEMVLTSYVPKLLGANIRALVEASMNPADIDLWAVHPGGKSIVDEVQKALGLTDEQVASPRAILRNYGNMSSATILFVLDDLLARATEDASVCAMAFGPGLTVELFQMDVLRN